MNETYSVLIASSLEGEALEMAQKIKSHFQLPMNVFTASDGNRAKYLYDQNHPNILFLTLHLPLLDGRSLIRQIRETDGSIAIYVLGRKGDELDEPGIEIIETPIENWTSVFARVAEEIPENMKAKYGIRRRDEKLVSLLEGWVKRELNIAPHESRRESDALVLIPDFFDGTVDDYKMEDDHSPSRQTNPAKEEERVERPSRWLADFSLLGGLLAVTFAAFLWTDPMVLEDSIIHFPLVASVITGLSFFGFFVGRALLMFRNRTES